MVVVVGLREGEGGEEGWGGGDGAWGVERGIGGMEGAVAWCEIGGWVVSQWVMTVMMTGVAAVLGVAFWVDADCSMFWCYGVFICRVNCFHCWMYCCFFFT